MKFSIKDFFSKCDQIHSKKKLRTFFLNIISVMYKEHSKNARKYLQTGCTTYRPDLSDLSTWENCSPWDFDHNSIQNTIILGDAVENSLTSKLKIYLSTF